MCWYSHFLKKSAISCHGVIMKAALARSRIDQHLALGSNIGVIRATFVTLFIKSINQMMTHFDIR